MKSNILFAQLIFISLISFIISQITWVDYNPKTNSALYRSFKNSKTQMIAVDFKSYTLPYYMKITLIPENGINTPLLCFSHTYANYNKDRQALARRTDGKPVQLFIKREQFKRLDSELFIYVKCEEKECGYTLKFEGGQSAEIDVNSVYSYVVTSDNREMRFEVIGEAEKGSYLTIGIEGSPTATLNIEDIDEEPINLDNGKIITFPINDRNNNVLVKI